MAEALLSGDSEVRLNSPEIDDSWKNKNKLVVFSTLKTRSDKIVFSVFLTCFCSIFLMMENMHNEN